MTEWLSTRWQWLVALVFMSALTSTTIGLKQGARGGAIFASNLASSITALAIYPLADKYGYGGPFVGLLALFCGACGMALFGVLIALSNLIERRKDRLAGSLLDRVAPDAREP